MNTKHAADFSAAIFDVLWRNITVQEVRPEQGAYLAATMWIADMYHTVEKQLLASQQAALTC
jgi:hypothetical protein